MNKEMPRRTRSRTCDNPPPQNGGSNCTTEGKSETEDCKLEPCSVDGNWGLWKQWSNCSQECGGGRRMRLRECNNPAPVQGGKMCEGRGQEEGDCNNQECPGSKHKGTGHLHIIISSRLLQPPSPTINFRF